MRKVLVAVCVSSLVFAAAGYAAKHATGGPSLQKQADLYQIENLEKTWHRAASKKNLDNLASSLSEFGDSRLLLVGHTDDTGSDTYNTDLSRRRANAVARYLISRGVPSCSTRPPFMTAIRSLIASASSWSWVT